jgi:hypothetical protein
MPLILKHSLNTAHSPFNSSTASDLCYLSDSLSLNTTRLHSPLLLPVSFTPQHIVSVSDHVPTRQPSVPPAYKQEWTTTTHTTHGPIPMIILRLSSSCHPRYSIACSALSSIGAHVTQSDPFQIGGGQDTQQVVVLNYVGVIHSPLSIPIV